MDTDTLYSVSGGWVDTVAGYSIKTVGGQLFPYVYKDSNFYNLYYAFETGYITKKDVYDIGLKIDSTFLKNNPKP